MEDKTRIYRCRYETKFVEKETGRVQLMTQAGELPVAFPLKFLEKHGLEVGDIFDLYREKGQSFTGDEVRVKKYQPEPLTQEEIERLKRFVNCGRTIDEILEDF